MFIWYQIVNMNKLFQNCHFGSNLAVTSVALAALTQTQLDGWAVQARSHIQDGQLPNYIPCLLRLIALGLP